MIDMFLKTNFGCYVEYASSGTKVKGREISYRAMIRIKGRHNIILNETGSKRD